MAVLLSRGALALLLRLLNSSNLSILGEILFDEFPSVANELLDGGYLEPAGASHYLAQGGGDFNELIWHAKTESYRYFSSAVGWVTVSAAQVQRFRVVMGRLLTWLGGLFELGSAYRPISLCESVLWHLGVARFGQYKVNLYFVRRLEAADNLRAFMGAIRKEAARAPTLIVSTSTSEILPIELPVDMALVPLERLLVRGNTLCTLDHSAVLTILRGCSIAKESDSGIGLRFSTDYRQVHWNGMAYQLTKKQAAVVEALDREGGRAHKDLLQAEANTNEALHRIMRNKVQGKWVTHPLWGTLIKGEGNGYYALEPG